MHSRNMQTPCIKRVDLKLDPLTTCHRYLCVKLFSAVNAVSLKKLKGSLLLTVLNVRIQIKTRLLKSAILTEYAAL